MKYVFTLLFCLSVFLCQGQNLELEQLKSIINQPVPSITDSLIKQGWTVRPELSGVQGNQLYQTFSFGDSKDEQAKALAWLRVHADNEIINQLYYQLPTAEQYELVLKQIKAVATEKKGVPNADGDKNINAYYLSSYYTFQTITGDGNYTIMLLMNKTPQEKL